MFVRSGGVWTQQQELTESGAQEDYFGWSVSLSGDTALIGTPGKSNINQDQGAAFVFVRNGDIWTRQQKLTAADGVGNARFGAPLSLNGDTALIAGGRAVYVFALKGEVWTQQQELTPSDGAIQGDFGATLSLSGSTAVIGDITGNGEGSAYVFVQK